MKRQMRQAWKQDTRRRAEAKRGTNVLAKQKWQVKTIQVLEEVFQERLKQFEKHGDAMADLPSGVGPRECWLEPVLEVAQSAYSGGFENTTIQEIFREDYQGLRGAENPDGQFGQLTRMHLVREELAEAFECEPGSPEFRAEILQVAALCVQWAELES